MIGLKELALVAVVVLVLYGRSGVLKSRRFQSIWPWIAPVKRQPQRPGSVPAGNHQGQVDPAHVAGSKHHRPLAGPLWFRLEGTLSIHSIFTNRREAFYWLAILFTFALGTAAGDLVAEQFALGYFSTGILFGMIIASLAFGYFFLELDPILGFWLAYIFTRPLGASFGDLLSQPAEYGGLGFGTIITSLLFLAVIVAIVIYMTLTHEGEELAVAEAAGGRPDDEEEVAIPLRPKLRAARDR